MLKWLINKHLRMWRFCDIGPRRETRGWHQMAIGSHENPFARNERPAATRRALHLRRRLPSVRRCAQLLEEHGFSPTCVDVDADPQLRERFNECVPVVEIDGRIRFRGRVNPRLLRRLIHGPR